MVETDFENRRISKNLLPQTAMNKQHITTAVWITVTASAFALGWILKPAGDGEGQAGNLSIASEADLASKISGHRKGSTEKAGEAGSANKTTAPVPLTSESIAALGKQFREATDPLARRSIFAKLLAGLTAENALEIREQIADLEKRGKADGRVTISSPASGVVLEKAVVEGAHVMAQRGAHDAIAWFMAAQTQVA